MFHIFTKYILGEKKIGAALDDPWIFTGSLLACHWIQGKYGTVSVLAYTDQPVPVGPWIIGGWSLVIRHRSSTGLHGPSSVGWSLDFLWIIAGWSLVIRHCSSTCLHGPSSLASPWISPGSIYYIMGFAGAWKVFVTLLLLFFSKSCPSQPFFLPLPPPLYLCQRVNNCENKQGFPLWTRT